MVLQYSTLQAGRDLRSSSSATYLKQLQLKQGAQGCVQFSFDCSKSWIFHSLCQYLFPVFDHLHDQKKKGHFLELNIFFSFVTTCLLPLALPLCSFARGLAPVLLCSSIRLLKTTARLQQSLPFLLVFFFFNLEEIQFSVSPLLSPCFSLST